MNLFIFLLTCTLISMKSVCCAGEIDYSSCQSMEDVIVRESQEIANTDFADHDELAQLFVARGESNLLCSNFSKALEDFQNAYNELGFCLDSSFAAVVAFRASFGQVICYDNLRMDENTQSAIQKLQSIIKEIECDDCLHQYPCHGNTNKISRLRNFQNRIILCKNKKEQNGNSQENYSDILGPNEPPTSDWCEEIVVGVGRSMDAIAACVPNYAVKIALIGIIEALIQRGLKCCQAGGFWKACVAPISRKWKEWKDNKEKHILPNTKNLPSYVN